jgi:pimeloyl-ACP methyl ester carboxylesterase
VSTVEPPPAEADPFETDTFETDTFDVDMVDVDVDGVRIRVRDTTADANEGTSTDVPAVVLLHGIGRSLEDWDEQHTRLVGRRVVSMDLAGFGLSDPPRGAVTLQALADVVLAVLDAIGVDAPAHLVGNSLGGAVAMQVVATAPRRVRSLVLVDSAGFSREVTPMLRAIGVPVLGRWLLDHGRDDASLRRVEEAIFADPALVTPERLRTARAVAEQPDHARVYVAMVRHLGSVRGVRAGWRDALLPRVAGAELPTLVVWGDRDRILPPAGLDAARRAFPHAQSHVFADTGHMPQIERPDEFAALVNAFLARAPSHPPRRLTGCTKARSRT